MSAPISSHAGPVDPRDRPSYTVVIPTIGRNRLVELLQTLLQGGGTAPDEVIIVDDRPDADALAPVAPDAVLAGSPVPVRVLRSGGQGPATARNTGWSAARSDWIAFLDDDVRIPAVWPGLLVTDVGRCGPDVAGCTAEIAVPPPPGRPPTDDERNTLGLAGARWITADIAYRRSVLEEVGGFDQTFRRAYREDSDLALRVINAGYRIVPGSRVTEHPVRAAEDDHWTASVRRQRGNADDALMLARHGRDWRRRSGAGPGRLPMHAATTGAAATAIALALSGRRRTALLPAGLWAWLTGRFALGRILPGPRSATEITRMVVSSAVIGPVAVFHRLRGEYATRLGSAGRPRYVHPHVRPPGNGRVATPAAGGVARTAARGTR